MIEPGTVSLELILNNPLYYLLFVYVGAAVLSMLSAWWADREEDNKAKANAKIKNPALTQAELDNTYVYEKVSDSLIAGLIVCVLAVFPLAQSLDSVAGWQAVFAAAIGAGLTARMKLMTAIISPPSITPPKP